MTIYLMMLHCKVLPKALGCPHSIIRKEGYRRVHHLCDIIHSR
jgi:hypothetical protein